MNSTNRELINSNDNEKMVDKLKTLISENKEKDALKFLYELISYFISDKDSSSKIKSLILLLKEKLKNNTQLKEFFDSYFVQTLWIFGNQLTLQNSNKKDKDQINKINHQFNNYKNLVNLLVGEKIISKIELIGKLEKEILIQIGFFTEEDYKSKYTKVNTKIFEQNKFNLLREESEGYSKLISFLYDINELQKKLDEKGIEAVYEKIINIIGYFNLDSYRVLDITLEIFKYTPFNLNYIKIFDILNKKIILPIFDFKFSESQNRIDKNLMVVAAQLIHFDYISLEDFILHLTPSLSELQHMFVKRNESIYEYVKNSLNEDIKNEISSYEDLQSNNKSQNKTANYFCNFQKITSKAVNYGNTDNTKNNNVNQFYLLFESFIAIKDKKNIIKMYNIIKDFYDPVENVGVIYELCNLISWMINPLLKSNTINNVKEIVNDKEENYISQCFNFDSFTKEIPEILKILNVGLSKDQILFQKLLSILNENINEIKKNMNKYNDLFINIFFPSLSLIDPCPSLLKLVWNYISSFDYKIRYNLYEEWLIKSYKLHPFLIIKSIVVWKEIQKWQKSLSLENSKKHGKILQIITNSNPVIAFESIINIVILYENQIEMVISSLNSCSNLSLDVVTYIICKILHEDSRPRLDIEIIGIDKNFKHFCDFISCFYKKYHNAEISGVFNFMIDKFNKKPEDMDIYILKELIEKMSGIHTQESLTKEQIISESGGYKLYFYLECKNLRKETRSLKKPISSLMKIIQSNDNLISLFLLLNLQKRKVLYSKKIHFQIMSFIYDQILLISLQFQKLINYHGKNEIYNKILKSLPPEKLINKYHFRPQNIFRLLRKKK